MVDVTHRRGEGVESSDSKSGYREEVRWWKVTQVVEGEQGFGVHTTDEGHHDGGTYGNIREGREMTVDQLVRNIIEIIFSNTLKTEDGPGSV